MRRQLTLLASILLIGGITSCGNNHATSLIEAYSYQIIFNANGGDLEMESMIYSSNQSNVLPVPTKEGYEFVGWYVDEALTTPFNENVRYEGTIILYAKWEEITLRTISTKEEFLSIKTNGIYALVADIDLDGEELTPIGTRENPFLGSLDGKGHTISNYRIKTGLYNSLFGYVTGDISNLNISNSLTVNTSESTYVSLLVSHAYNANISKCAVKGNIEVNSTSEQEGTIVGSLVGYNELSNVSYCYSQTNITVNGQSTSFVGGLVGYNGGGHSQEGKVSSCYAKSSTISVTSLGIRGSAYAGGVVGANFGTIDKCFSYDVELSAKTSAYYAFVGGVVADNNGGRVTNSFGASNVMAISDSGNTHRGAVMGRNFKSTDDANNGTFDNCYALSTIKSNYSISSKYAKTTNHEQVVLPVAYLDDVKSASWYVDVLGFENFYIKDNYFPSLNSDFKKINYVASSGTIENPIIISTASELMNLDVSKSYKLGKDISLSSVAFKPIGTYFEPFRGSLDGNGHVISGLTITSETSSLYNGLFGYANALLKDVKVSASISFTASSKNIQYAGGLVAYSTKSYIDHCEVTIGSNIASFGLISGGLVGVSDNSTIIDSCAKGTVKGYSSNKSAYFGGLVGDNIESNIKQCCAKVDLSAGGITNSYIGGLVGKNEGFVSDTYAIGTIKNEKGTDLVYVGGLVGYAKRGYVKNSYTKVNLSCLVNPTAKLLGGLIGFNNTPLENCYYNANAEVLYSCGHSPIFVDVDRVDLEELKTLASKISSSFYDGEDNLPHLVFEKGGN